MSRNRTKVAELFGDDSDDEHRPENGAHNRRSSDAASAAQIDSKTKEVADKLADFVSKNGRHYEDLTREKNPGNTPFKFLWNKSSTEYKYYETKLNSLVQASGSYIGGSTSASRPQQHSNSRYEHSDYNSQGLRRVDHTQGDRDRRYDSHHSSHDRDDRSRLDRDRHGRGSGPSGYQQDRHSSRYNDRDSAGRGMSQQDTAEHRRDHYGSRHERSSWDAGRHSTTAPAPYSSHSRETQPSRPSGSEYEPASKRSRWEAGSQAPSSAQPSGPAAGGGNTLSAMEQYMKQLEQQAKQKREDDEEEERRRRAAAPLLKETAYDRRKVVAVFKEDGQRGHHMDDFIPKEELAKFMAKCGDTNLQQKVEAEAAIGSDNIGHKLLQKMGWKEGQGIGAKNDGRTVPVAAVKQDNLGLGAQAHGAVEETDDPFEQYRKRMMLGYKYRPNPLGNPRKAYY